MNHWKAWIHDAAAVRQELRRPAPEQQLWGGSMAPAGGG
eukprot:CAMPEP_0180657636 /NCGR_PEP_ID=MMETSP1037_2-20121125/56532_1 /TAXON_ID=632150 /ORGANISM="Azadinium spinosum, Strain 3D9" /LENGTH=38 /DNA_ID= /DNA_START= /DNA_END= /DNA_ORIENTATION=